ncbi:MAG: radical SAM protein [Deltaproteobacteria bacterium]|nr:MAG: radical SAM protein [Deltaproteobacteria bacterium]
MAVDKFICPLLWQHVSCHPDGDLRVCCHGLGHNKIEEGLSIFEADENVLNHGTYKSLRLQMLRGDVPSVCQSCFNIEKIGGESPRLKYLQATGDELENMITETQEDGSIERRPYELDLTLGNSCNFKCRMCSPMFSDKLIETFDHLGLKYNRETVSKIKERWNQKDINIPLLESPHLKSIIFQGGEPLIYRHHLDLLIKLVKSGRAKKMTLSYDTNFSVIPPECLELWKEFKSIELDISLDGVGKTFEYIRYGSDWNKVESNIYQILKSGLSNLRVQFSTLLQAGLVHDLKDLLDFCLELPDNMNRIPKFSLIESPDFLSLNATKKDVWEKSYQQIKNFPVMKLSKNEVAHYQELLKLLGSYQFDPELHFKFLAHTKALDKMNSKGGSYLELINPTP